MLKRKKNSSNFKRISKRLLFFRLAIIVLLGLVGISGRVLAEEYREVEVKDGGFISGKVVLKGEVPDPRIFHLILYPFEFFCKNVSDGKGERLLQEFTVSKDGGLQDTVVFLEEVPRGKPFSDIDEEIHSTDCVFHPFVSVVKRQQPVKVINDDPVIHNIQVYETEKEDILFNAPLAVQATETGILKFHPGVYISQWICGMHEFMQNWVHVVENPYYAITKEDGSFRIDAIPPGKYAIAAWHPHMKTISQQITVSAGKMSPVHFDFISSEVQYPEYERQQKGRITGKGKSMFPSAP